MTQRPETAGRKSKRGRVRKTSPQLGAVDPARADISVEKQVYRLLKRAIMSGVFAPGTSITTRSIAESLGVSSSPVRDALKRLEADSALESRNKSAYFLPILSAEDYAEVLTVRLRLEGYAAGEAAKRITDDEIAALVRYNDVYKGAGSARDGLNANFNFHLEIYKVCRSAVLIDTIANMWVRIGPTLHVDTVFGDGQSAVENHERIIQSLRDRDPAAAERALVRDLSEAGNVIMPRLRKTRRSFDELKMPELLQATDGADLDRTPRRDAARDPCPPRGRGPPGACGPDAGPQAPIAKRRFSVGYNEVVEASRRIAPFIRQTPVIKVSHLPGLACDMWLKLESLQVTGSFKARGAASRMTSLDPALLKNGVIAASGGNHGIATAYMARAFGVASTIYLPSSATPQKIEKLRRLGADVRIEGTIWDHAHAAATAESARTGAYYLHPFGDPDVVAGQGTVALDLLDQVPDADLYIVAIGGGGLISGMSEVIRSKNPRARIVGVEPIGSPTLHASLKAGHVVRLPEVTTRVATMGCGKTEDIVYEIVARNVDDVVLISDADMQRAAELLWFEAGIAADLSGAASLAAVLSSAVAIPDGAVVAGLVCGAGADGTVAQA